MIKTKRFEEDFSQENQLKKDMGKYIGMIIITIISVICIFVTTIVSYNKGFDKGFNRGLDEGFGIMSDTVIDIMSAQIKSDSTRTKLTIVDPDTNEFFLSRKTILDKHKR